ncbi:MAG: murein L,D-transpeptidase [Afipia sp.]|nr:murein L,D-transpeptidase [Afipia sp.]
MSKIIATLMVSVLLLGCSTPQFDAAKHLRSIPTVLLSDMQAKGMTSSDPILVRIFKQENELEVWKRESSGRYALLKTYGICRWSGQLGPKNREGDRQAPEGFYLVTPKQMNPRSELFLSFDLGFPNEVDRAHGRSGRHLMVHGECTSSGCYAMTNDGMAEIYALAREAFAGGQKGIQVQALPFRMTAENLAKYRADPNFAFWKNLKEGSDHFEVVRHEPTVDACGGNYVFNASAPRGPLRASRPCPELVYEPETAALVEEKQRNDTQQVAQLVRSGASAFKRVYLDGDMHKSYRRLLDSAPSYVSFNVAEVSRPEALKGAPLEMPIQ